MVFGHVDEALKWAEGAALVGVFVIWLVCPLDRPFPLTPGSSPGQVLTLSHDGDHCKTRWYGQRRDLDDFPGTPCEFASLARVPFAERRGGPPLSFGHFPRRAGATLPLPLVAVLQWSHDGERGFSGPIPSAPVLRPPKRRNGGGVVVVWLAGQV